MPLIPRPFTVFLFPNIYPVLILRQTHSLVLGIQKMTKSQYVT